MSIAATAVVMLSCMSACQTARSQTWYDPSPPRTFAIEDFAYLMSWIFNWFAGEYGSFGDIDGYSASADYYRARQ